MAVRRITLLREAHPGRPAYDAAMSRATLQRVARELEPETLRLYRPDRVVAFGRRDVAAPGYAAAVRAACDRGFAAIQRLAGGRAAVFHDATLAFAWAIPDPRARERIGHHFEELAEIMQGAFRKLGVDARIGQVPGEYCPGAHSVNAGGVRKLMGVGQRVVAGATHVGGVVVVGDSESIRDVLIPVYEALGLEWEPRSVGSLRDELGPLELDRVERAILDEFAARSELVPGSVRPATCALAERLELDHHSGA